MASDADAVDALFAEAFALLDGAPPPVSRPRSPLLAAPLAFDVAAQHGHHLSARETKTAKHKRAIRALQTEERQLSEQLERLRGHVPPQLHTLREGAMGAQLARRRAERERDNLRAAVYAHTHFLRGLRGLLSIAPPTNLSLNLCHHLHNFTRLPRDRTLRELEYAALRRDQRVHAAVDMLLRETHAVPLSSDFVDASCVYAPGEPCTVTSMSVFIMDDCDVPTVLRAACVAVRDIVVRCPTYRWLSVGSELVDVEALSPCDLQYRVASIRRCASDHGRDVEAAEAFSVESHAVTMYRLLGDAAVVLWDFVDQDELYAMDASKNDVTRQCVGASLIRREVCPDGVERTVYRELKTRRYTYRGTSPPPPRVARYLSSQQESMHSNERLFRDIMREEIAQEQLIAGGNNRQATATALPAAVNAALADETAAVLPIADQAMPSASTPARTQEEPGIVPSDPPAAQGPASGPVAAANLVEVSPDVEAAATNANQDGHAVVEGRHYRFHWIRGEASSESGSSSSGNDDLDEAAQGLDAEDDQLEQEDDDGLP